MKKIVTIIGFIFAAFSFGFLKGGSNKKEKLKKVKRNYAVKKRKKRENRRSDDINVVKQRLRKQTRGSSDRGKRSN